MGSFAKNIPTVLQVHSMGSVGSLAGMTKWIGLIVRRREKNTEIFIPGRNTKHETHMVRACIFLLPFKRDLWLSTGYTTGLLA